MKKKKNHLLISCLLIPSFFLNAQNINHLFREAEGGNTESQYELSMLFKQSLVLKKPLKNLKDYYLEEYLNSDLKELDTLLLEDYWFWANESFLHNLTESAENDNPLSQFELGKYYESKDNFGSELRAYYWIAKSAQGSNKEALAWVQNKKEELYLKKYLLPEDYDDVDFFIEVLNLSDSLCSIFYKNWQEKEVAAKVEKEIASFLKLEEDDPERTSKIIDFWNTYNKFFICEDIFDREQLKYMHILKKSLISLDFRFNQQLFNWLFELNNVKAIDFNQIIYFDNKPETILDVLIAICKDPMLYEHISSKDVCELGNKLIDQYNAKTALELLKE